MARGRNTRSSGMVADLPENRRDRPRDSPPNRGPGVSATCAPMPPSTGNTVGIPPQPLVQPTTHAVGMDIPLTWQQRQEALENTVMQLAETVRMLAQAQARAIRDPPVSPWRIRPQREERPPLVKEDIGDNYPPPNRHSPEREKSRRL